jgi:hypothetical protein
MIGRGGFIETAQQGAGEKPMPVSFAGQTVAGVLPRVFILGARSENKGVGHSLRHFRVTRLMPRAQRMLLLKSPNPRTRTLSASAWQVSSIKASRLTLALTS